MKFSTTQALLLFAASSMLLGAPPAQGRERPSSKKGEAESRSASRAVSVSSHSHHDRGRRFVRAKEWIAGGPKRVEIDLSAQQLQAWEGNRLVLRSRISSGRNGSTPTGHYRAGPYKSRHHHSTLYDSAYMPWSVQVAGNVFIHGFSSVPRYPASHGCIRLPVTGTNPARQFYEWVDSGTPVRIFR